GPGAFEADVGVVRLERAQPEGRGHVVVPAAYEERCATEGEVRLPPAEGVDGLVEAWRGDDRWPVELLDVDERAELRLASASQLHAESLLEPPLVALRAILVPAVEEEPLIRHGVERLPEEVALTENEVLAHPANGHAAQTRPHATVTGGVRVPTTTCTRQVGDVDQTPAFHALGEVEVAHQSPVENSDTGLVRHRRCC